MKEKTELTGYKFAERMIVVAALIVFLFYAVYVQVEHKVFFRESACDLCEDNTNRVCSSSMGENISDYYVELIDVEDLI